MFDRIVDIVLRVISLDLMAVREYMINNTEYFFVYLAVFVFSLFLTLLYNATRCGDNNTSIMYKKFLTFTVVFIRVVIVALLSSEKIIFAIYGKTVNGLGAPPDLDIISLCIYVLFDIITIKVLRTRPNIILYPTRRITLLINKILGNFSPYLLSSVASRLIRRRMGTAALLLLLAAGTYWIPMFADQTVLWLLLGAAALALVDIGLIVWGWRTQDYGLNRFEAEEVIEYLVEKMRKGDGPPGGWKQLYPDPGREHVTAMDGATAAQGVR